jgi:hypothetical protein
LDPDPKLGGKWDPDPDPDPKKIVTDPQHCNYLCTPFVPPLQGIYISSYILCTKFILYRTL